MTIMIIAASVLLLNFVVSPVLLYLSARIVRIKNVTFGRTYCVYGLFWAFSLGISVGVLLLFPDPAGLQLLPVVLGCGLLGLLVRNVLHATTRQTIVCLFVFIPLTVAAVLVVGKTAVRVFVVPAGVMSPTLLRGERIAVDGITLRFREPRKGEIIMFRPPHDQKTTYMQRVVATAGDRVEVRDDTVYVNGVASGRCVPEKYSFPGMTRLDFPCTVPPGKLFMLGDNRDSSFDSRMYGFADVNAVVGLAGIVYASPELPLDKYETRKLLEEGKDPKQFNHQWIRWERIGTILR